ncbi:GreA/GreB family elongation factor [Deinococcus budaensis]|uniref:Transcription elongation factor GreA n=1 Tax=Deinococcus budaensis TaxID=1665626 RepID=A0A7W8LQA4_9DEIO|nr:GreA/GreB family elongation factor [Deinococcus budaensis]MBB5234410.1 transcription elongation factor GreA [Deinococcus budaensis]
MTQKIELTSGGLSRLQQTLTQEYARLEEARRVVQEQMEANEQESLGLAEAQRLLLATEDRIAELEDSLARAVVIERAALEQGASLGAVVTLLDTGTGRELRLQLVNPLEASATAGALPRVSTQSPVGRAVLGRRPGDTFTVDLGRRQASYQVLGVSDRA